MSISSVKTTINGTQYNLVYNDSTGKWEATLTAPAASSFNQPDGYYGVLVTVADTAGNNITKDQTDAVLGSSLRLFVKEKQPPVVNIISPGAGAYVTTNIPQITFTLRDTAVGNGGDSGINLDTLALIINGGTAIGSTAVGMSVTPVDGGYDCTYTPQAAFADGQTTISVDITDNDGNAAVTASRTFTIDTTAPELNITSPADGLITNESRQIVTGTTEDVHSAPVTVIIKLNDVDQGAVTVSEDGAFSKEIILTEGENVLVVTATDGANKSTTVTHAVTLKTSMPTIESVELVPNPVDSGLTYVIRVVVRDGQ